MRKIIKYFRKYIYCRHIYLCTNVYETFAKYRCKKCRKSKNGFAPVIRFENEYEKNREYFKNDF